MKHALALILLSCALVAQENPSSSAIQSIDPALVKNVSGGSVVEGPTTVDVIKPAKAKPAIPPVNVRDELIELIHALKVKAHTAPYAPSAAMYEAGMKAKTEDHRLLLQALVELSNLPEESTTVYHSSNPKPPSLESKSNIGRKPIIIK